MSCSSTVAALFESTAHTRAISRIFLGSSVRTHSLPGVSLDARHHRCLVNSLNGDELVCVFSLEGPSPSLGLGTPRLWKEDGGN